MNVKTLTHSQQTTTHSKAHKKKSTVGMTYRTVFWSPKVSFLQVLGLGWSQVQDTHSATEDSVENLPETVNLTGNAAQHKQFLTVTKRMLTRLQV